MRSMVSGITYVCNHCINMVLLRHQMFYVDPEGVRQRWGCPVYDLPEARDALVKGWEGVMYCKKCRHIKVIIVSEGDQEFAKVCPDCGSELTNEIENELCSECNEGKLELLNRWCA